MLSRHSQLSCVSARAFSADDMRAYKSLEAFNQVVKGWVRDVKVMTTSGLKVVNGKVIRLTSLKLFVYAFPSYKILPLRRTRR